MDIDWGNIPVLADVERCLSLANESLIPAHFTCTTVSYQWRSQPDIWSCKCKFFCLYRRYKELIPKEINNDNDLNLHLHDQILLY